MHLCEMILYVLKKFKPLILSLQDDNSMINVCTAVGVQLLYMYMPVHIAKKKQQQCSGGRTAVHVELCTGTGRSSY